MAARKDGAAVPATDSTVTRADWEGEDISEQEHTRVLFVDLDMTEVRNIGAVFTECTFRNAKLNCSVHTDSAFVNCTFSGCNLFDARFDGCKLVGTKFDRCTFELLKVEGGNWSHVGLAGADLRAATFTDVRMREADLTKARLEGASLRGVDLSEAWLHGAKLDECDLRGSDLGAIDFEGVELKGAIVSAQQAVTIAMALGLDVRED